MKWTILGLVLVGIVAAGAAAALAVSLQARSNAGTAVDPANQLITVVVAAQDLPANTIVDSTMVLRKEVRRGEAAANVMTNETQAIGHLLINDILKGATFTNEDFPGSDSDLKISHNLQKGMRAMAIMLSTETGIEDILYPGCLVDVVATFRLPPANGQGYGDVVSTTVLQQIPVLKVGQRSIMADKAANEGSASATDSKRGRMITLKVTSKQAQMLQLAVTQGTVALSMRSPLDKDTETIDAERLEGLSKELAEKLANLNRVETPNVVPTIPTVNAPDANSSPNPAPIVAPEPKEEDPLWKVILLRNGHIVDEQKFPWPLDMAPKKKK